MGWSPPISANRSLIATVSTSRSWMSATNALEQDRFEFQRCAHAAEREVAHPQVGDRQPDVAARLLEDVELVRHAAPSCFRRSVVR